MLLIPAFIKNEIALIVATAICLQKDLMATLARLDTDENMTNMMRITPIDRDGIEECRKVMQYNPAAGAAFNAICHYIFGGDILVKIKNKSMTSENEKDLSELLSKSWSKFGRDVLHQVLSYGIVVIGLGEENKPYVVDLENLEIGFRYDFEKGERVYSLKEFNPDIMSKDQKKRKNAQAAFFPVSGSSNVFKLIDDKLLYEFFPPTVEGTLRSPVTTILRMHYFVNTTIRNAMQATTRMANPPFTTELTQGTIEDMKISQDMNYAGGEHSTHINNFLSQIESTTNELMTAEIETRRLNSLLGSRREERDPITGTKRYSLHGTEVPYSRFPVIVPPGRKYVPTQASQAPPFLSEALQLETEIVSQAFLIPQDVFNPKQGASAVEVAESNSTFHRTTMAYCKYIADVFSDILKFYFLKPVKQTAVKTKKRKTDTNESRAERQETEEEEDDEHKSEGSYTQEDAFNVATVKQNMKLDVFEISFSSAIGQTNVLLLMQLGLIKWEYAKQYLARSLVITEDALDNKVALEREEKEFESKKKPEPAKPKVTTPLKTKKKVESAKKQANKKSGNKTND